MSRSAKVNAILYLLSRRAGVRLLNLDCAANCSAIDRARQRSRFVKSIAPLDPCRRVIATVERDERLLGSIGCHVNKCVVFRVPLLS